MPIMAQGVGSSENGGDTHGAILVSLGTIVTLGAVVMNPTAGRSFEAAKLGAILPAAGALTVALAWCLFTRAAFRVREFFILAGVFVAAGLATATSPAPLTALFGGWVRSEGMLAWSIALLAGIAACVLTISRGTGKYQTLLIDAILLSGLVPATYALVQWAGFDFLRTSSLAPGQSGFSIRPGGSFGNPGYLASYLVLLVPLVAARAANTTGRRERTAWFFVCALFSAALLATQSRGAFIGLLAGSLVLLAYGLSALVKRGKVRRQTLTRVCQFALLFVFLALMAIATSNALREALSTFPPLSRLLALGKMDDSQLARLGIWNAGLSSFVEAPLMRKVIGSGFDVFHWDVTRYISARVFDIEGDGVLIDRMHNATLDLMLSIGALGTLAYVFLWHVGVSRAYQYLYGRRLTLMRSAAITLLPALLAAFGAGLLKDSLVAGIVAFTAGIGLGWGCILVSGATRRLFVNPAVDPRATRSPGGETQGDRLLVAAISGALVGSWIDAQINVVPFPVRIVQFVLIGFLLAKTISPRVVAPTSGPIPRDCFIGYLGFLACAMALPAFLPALHTATLEPPGLPKSIGQVLPILVCAATCAVFSIAIRVDSGLQMARRKDALLVISATATLLAAYFGPDVMRSTGSAPVAADWQMGLPTLLVYFFASACMLIAIWRSSRCRRLLALTFLLAVPGHILGSADLRADILSKTAAWSLEKGDSNRAREQIERAVSIIGLPHYHAVLGSRYLADAVDRIGKSVSIEDWQEVAEYLRRAEAHARQAWDLEPTNPESMLGLGNVLQIQSLRSLQPIVGEAASKTKSEEATRLLMEAISIAPRNKLLWRNASQIAFDRGDVVVAYSLLDQMEALNPKDPEAYRERARMASALGDHHAFATNRRRAEMALGKEAAGRILNGF
jgi:hypothetical protein